ncbi:hypothetical protein OOT00_11865 [Desulfobotulus sp. H1]|uniref:DUF1795 domain-containing protein n=1 Tax=Desulfobotulus pelophilus TaxID=2823377 RepID=A0ABT3NB34_9BACT|nr:hypothetical protein [Desulfobotulus pelophilus]MCW7754679.1 hypothetical protein [Desulfobotulus pelophilus]
MRSSPVHTVLLLFLCVFCTACAGIHQAATTGPYFITLEQDSHNGMLGESRLLMVSAPEEYRADAWTVTSVSVTIPSQPGQDGRERALKTAWKTLLFREGTQSIQARSSSEGRHTHTSMTLRYEGLVEEPMRIVSFIREEKSISLTLETRFAPIAFPDQWEKLHKKQKRQETAKEILSVFR